MLHKKSQLFPAKNAPVYINKGTIKYIYKSTINLTKSLFLFYCAPQGGMDKEFFCIKKSFGRDGQ